MKRIPVTQASYKKIPKTPIAPGKTISASSHPIDKEKNKIASFMGGLGRAAWNRPTMLGGASSFYQNSYMGGGSSGFGDMPQYFAFLNEQNGGVLYYPVTLKEKYEWYRYFFRADPYVHAAISLHTDLPMSKLVLRMPKMKDRQKRKNILAKYQKMVNDLKLFDKLHSILFETNVIGNCFVFVQYNDEKQVWDKITILPPEEIDVANYPMSDIKCVQYRPEILNAIISKYSFPLDNYNKYCKYVEGLDEDEKQVLQDVDFELVKQLKENNGKLIMDTNPYSGDGNSKIGSFVFHFCEKRHEYQDLGVSPLECILTPLLMKEHYKHTQLSLASRNMTPRNLVSAQGISKDALDDLRDQIDQSMLSPDYSIVTNYDIHWETIGAENRLIDLSREYDTIENQIFAGLGVTREILTGEGMYSGNKISVEILNTRYLFKRELLQHFVEDNLFKPYALQNGFYEDDDNGNRTWFYPRLSFTRLTIRDNSEVFDSLFQLYQKGSIPIGTILDLFNLDEDEIDEKLKRDMFTPKDAVYNDMLRGVYSTIGDQLVQGTDLAKQIIESITGPQGRKLVYKNPDEENGGDDGGYDDSGDDEFDGGSFDEGGLDNSGFDESDEKEPQYSLEDIVDNAGEEEKKDEAESNASQDDMIKKYLMEMEKEDKEIKENEDNKKSEESSNNTNENTEQENSSGSDENNPDETDQNKDSDEKEDTDSEPNIKESFKVAKKK